MRRNDYGEHAQRAEPFDPSGLIRRVASAASRRSHRKHRPELEADPAVLAQLLHCVEQRRDQLGRTEPYWSILTSPEFKAESIANSMDAFYQTGTHDMVLLRRTAERCGIALPWYGTCLEVGCGVGRLIPSLRIAFDQVVGLDVSPSHLALAQDLVRRRGYTNVRLHLANRIDALQQLPEFDCFFSVIALQHNPPPIMNWLLHGMLQRLKRGGIGFFQLPVSTTNSSFRAIDYLATPPAQGQIEVHSLPQQTLFTLLHETGCDLLDMREHDCIGAYSDGTSKVFLVRKAR